MIAGVARKPEVQRNAAKNRAVSLRWIAVTLFLLSNSLNFLDRQLLSAVAPLIQSEFRLSNTQYGQLLSGFALVYGVMAPLVGAVIDRTGLFRGAVTSVFIWSLASAVTGFTHTFRGLLLSRMGLGLGEAGALPCSSKAAAVYLDPAEWGLASTVGSVAVMMGSVSAPLLVAAMAPRYGWRSVFVLSGCLGAFWIVVWMVTDRKAPPAFEPTIQRDWPARRILGDPRLWRLALSYSLVMVFYVFWLGWTTLYLVQARHLTAVEANRHFAWIPPLFATAGGLLSGGLAFRSIRRGDEALRTRVRLAWLSAPVVLISAAVPWIASTQLAVLTIGISLLACMSIITSVN